MPGRAIVVLLVLGACNGDPPGDAVPAMRVECDPGQQGCPAGQACDLVCDAAGSKVACRPAGAVPAGAACQNVDACAVGTGCYATASAASGGSSCVAFCRTDADCATGRCQERQVSRACLGGPVRYTLRFCLP